MDNVDSYMIYANYSGSFVKPYFDDEYKLDYFIEDFALNSFYYYLRHVIPFWLDLQDGDMLKNFRGYYYYFYHQQLLGRYYLERISNDLGDIEDFDWNKPFYPGYYSTLMYHNGIAMPQRSRYMNVPLYKYKYLKVRLLFRYSFYNHFIRLPSTVLLVNLTWIFTGDWGSGIAHHECHRPWLRIRKERQADQHLHSRRFKHTRKPDRRQRRFMQSTLLRNVRRSRSRHPRFQLGLQKQEQDGP